MIKIVTGFSLTLILILCACNKPHIAGSEPFLTLDYGVINFKNTVGSKHNFTVQSNTNWKLMINPATTDWLSLDNVSGNGSKTIIASAVKDNTLGSPRMAEIIATAVNAPMISPVHLTVIQNDTVIIK